MKASILSLLSICAAAACSSKIDAPNEIRLKGQKIEPGIHTEGLNPDLFIVVRTVPYGHGDLMVLVVAEDGNDGRWTFVAPSALDLKPEDVIKVHRFCYRARETYGHGRLETATNGCTDIVIPHRPEPPKAERETK